MFPLAKDQKKIDKIKLKFFHTEPELGSSFKAAVFRPSTLNQVHQAYVKLAQDYPTADHIAVACSVNGEEAYQDNGEHGSAFRILRCIKQAELDNIAVFMLRHYGGTNLGPRRFTIMTELARAAIDKAADFPIFDASAPRSRTSSSSSGSSTHSTPSQQDPTHQDT